MSPNSPSVNYRSDRRDSSGTVKLPLTSVSRNRRGVVLNITAELAGLAEAYADDFLNDIRLHTGYEPLHETLTDWMVLLGGECGRVCIAVSAEEYRQALLNVAVLALVMMNRLEEGTLEFL